MFHLVFHQLTPYPMAATWFWSPETENELEGKCCKAGNRRKAEGKVSGESPEQNTISKRGKADNVNIWTGIEEGGKGVNASTGEVCLYIQLSWGYVLMMRRILSSNIEDVTTYVLCIQRDANKMSFQRARNPGWLHRVSCSVPTDCWKKELLHTFGVLPIYLHVLDHDKWLDNNSYSPCHHPSS